MKEPKLRFKEFTGEWKPVKLSDIAEKITTKNENKTYKTVLTNSAIYGVVNQQEFFDKDIANPENIERYTVIKDNDYMYNPRISNYAKFGPVNRNKLNINGIASPMYLVFRVSDNVSLSFLDNYFSSSHWYRYIYANGNSGARADRIAIKDDDFMSMKIPMPSLEEQQKIGAFFDDLDSQIKLQSDKLKTLKRDKEGYLQKMFPSNNNEPKVRLCKSDDNWVEHKLSDYLSLPTKEEQIDVTDTSQIMTLKLHNKGLSRTNRDTLSLGSTNYYARHTGQFIYGKQNFFNGSMDIVPDEFDGIATSKDVPALDVKDIDTNFLITYISRKPFLHHAESLSNGTGSKRLHERDLLNLKIKVPSLMEQKMIGMFFDNLDKQINFQEEKLANLKKQKEAYLQKMFI